MHVIAGKAVCFFEALQPEFAIYQKQLLSNMQALVKTLQAEGFILISGGSENHMCLVNVKDSVGISGKKAERLLDEAGITCNKNSIPYDTEKPFTTSGIRLGTPAMTTRGFKEEEFKQVGHWIAEVLKNSDNEELRKRIRLEVIELTHKYPLTK